MGLKKHNLASRSIVAALVAFTFYKCPVTYRQSAVAVKDPEKDKDRCVSVDD